jgi:hypothetical protein
MSLSILLLLFSILLLVIASQSTAQESFDLSGAFIDLATYGEVDRYL